MPNTKPRFNGHPRDLDKPVPRYAEPRAPIDNDDTPFPPQESRAPDQLSTFNFQLSTRPTRRPPPSITIGEFLIAGLLIAVFAIGAGKITRQIQMMIRSLFS